MTKKFVCNLASVVVLSILCSFSIAQAAPAVKKAKPSAPLAPSPVPSAPEESAEVKAPAEPAEVKIEEPKQAKVENEAEKTTQVSNARSWRLGPTVAIAIPHPANVGLEGRFFHKLAGFAFTYGFLPEMTVSDVSAKMTSWDLRARLHPFRGAFFLGAAYGNQDLTGRRSENILGTSQSTTLKISTTTFTPHIGWRWGDRFVFGIDLGVQLSLKHKNTLTTTASGAQQSDPAYTQAINDLNKIADDIGSATLPFITLLHFGFMF